VSLFNSVLFVLDLLAAFDAANNILLISKMVEMLISRSVLLCFISYLDDSRYQVNWKGLHALLHRDWCLGLYHFPFTLGCMYCINLKDAFN